MLGYIADNGHENEADEHIGTTSKRQEVLVQAKHILKMARTADELRQAQAVILPLDYGFSMAEVAATRS